VVLFFSITVVGPEKNPFEYAKPNPNATSKPRIRTIARAEIAELSPDDFSIIVVISCFILSLFNEEDLANDVPSFLIIKLLVSYRLTSERT
jgi:hypothetical protein